MKRIISWLNAPYFFNPSKLYKLKTSCILGLFVFLFLFLFKPFTLSTFGDILLEYTLIIGGFTFIWSFLIMYIPPLIFKSFFNEDKWTTGKSLLLIILGILIFGIFLWFFAGHYKKDKNIENLSLPLYLLYTFLVGTFPTFFIVYINERSVRIRRVKKIKEIRDYKQKKINNKKIELKEKVTIFSENQKESINFYISNLVYITSQGNYASFFIKNDNGQLKEMILRVTLTKIEKELLGYSKVIRCHKSYIVNTNYFQNISGNARGYLLESDILSLDIPVSRSFSKQSLLSFLD